MKNKFRNPVACPQPAYVHIPEMGSVGIYLFNYLLSNLSNDKVAPKGLACTWVLPQTHTATNTLQLRYTKQAQTNNY